MVVVWLFAYEIDKTYLNIQRQQQGGGEGSAHGGAYLCFKGVEECNFFCKNDDAE